MLIQEVSFSMFRSAFIQAGRGDQYTREGAELIYDYLQYDPEPEELDVIAICGQFDEWDIDEFMEYYGLVPTIVEEEEEPYENISDDTLKEFIEEYVNQKALLLGFTCGSTVVCTSF